MFCSLVMIILFSINLDIMFPICMHQLLKTILPIFSIFDHMLKLMRVVFFLIFIFSRLTKTWRKSNGNEWVIFGMSLLRWSNNSITACLLKFLVFESKLWSKISSKSKKSNNSPTPGRAWNLKSILEPYCEFFFPLLTQI